MFGRKFVTAENLFCKVQCDSVYGHSTGRTFDAAEMGFSPGRPKFVDLQYTHALSGKDNIVQVLATHQSHEENINQSA